MYFCLDFYITNIFNYYHNNKNDKFLHYLIKYIHTQVFLYLIGESHKMPRNQVMKFYLMSSSVT